MSFVNYASREITYKLVYYGPGLCGKTTNVEHLHRSARATARGKLVSLTTETERTLFFDFMPLTVGKLSGFDVRFHLYTVPGQVFYRASRRLILGGVDGVVFVADSQRERLEANLESIEDMHECLREHGLEAKGVPLVLQCNKQDHEDAVTLDELRRELGLEHVPTISAVAVRGIGVRETFERLAKTVVSRVGRR
ncbi:GTP-binding protein [Paraliomyxa miuraensis]|uniref:GTP-binding protein n=1 Tax=Paraliomyxa miuraensis TaxID=376150 RepID=UPI002251FC1D|nr:GTPase domain-containing protein [Paraliomyxa miuraensis]MCX4247375.1 GTPase domain-containing protein [Paraliomyxa miuraensis]